MNERTRRGPVNERVTGGEDGEDGEDGVIGGEEIQEDEDRTTVLHDVPRIQQHHNYRTTTRPLQHTLTHTMGLLHC